MPEHVRTKHYKKRKRSNRNRKVLVLLELLESDMIDCGECLKLNKVCDQYSLFSAGFCIVKNMERKALYSNFSFIHIIQGTFKNNFLAFLFSSHVLCLTWNFSCFVGCLQTGLSTQVYGFFL